MPAPDRASAPVTRPAPTLEPAAKAPGQEDDRDAEFNERSLKMYLRSTRMLREINEATALHVTDCPAMARAMKEVLDRHLPRLPPYRFHYVAREASAESPRRELKPTARISVLAFLDHVARCQDDAAMQEQLARFTTRVVR